MIFPLFLSTNELEDRLEMAKKLLKAGETKNLFLDALGIAITKNVEERLLTPFIGNGTLVSAGVKGVAGVGIPMIGGDNKWTRMISTAFIVDAMEDVVNTAFQFFQGATANRGSTDNWT